MKHDLARSMVNGIVSHLFKYFYINSIFLFLQAIDHIINSAAKMNYMFGGQIPVPIVFRGPNGSAVGIGAQHIHVMSIFYKFEVNPPRVLL